MESPNTAFRAYVCSGENEDAAGGGNFEHGVLVWREFPLVGLVKYNPVSLCGSLYALPCRTTLRVRNALHLIEASNRVAYMSGIFQRLLALPGESKLGCGYPVTTCLR
jgi:hypothetical protein